MQDLKRIAEEALDKKDHLGAMLTVVELGLQEGDQIPELARRVLEEGKEDGRLQEYLTAFAKGIKPQKALDVLDGLSRDGVARAHVIDVNSAVLKNTLRKPAEAVNLYAKALTVNPFLVGAWKDLGDIYRGRYETPLAWTCYEVARRITPRHPMLADVDRTEARMRELFPDFF